MSTKPTIDYKIYTENGEKHIFMYQSDGLEGFVIKPPYSEFILQHLAQKVIRTETAQAPEIKIHPWLLPNFTTTLGTRIKDIRGNLTQTEFGNRVGIKQNSVAAIENDRNLPSTSLIINIAKEFNIDLHWLLTGSYFGF